ncbi:hypothetical protein GE061_017287 [Apolygus lucorum]|uniref:Lipase n=1 Tax=Apolygus lucorum TaxID=248454 RepID=A0A8S9XAL4_APOLU|nr:hypothetical protein GE061_017287 [Apolygus lucorum]
MAINMSSSNFLFVLCLVCGAVAAGLCQSRGKTIFPRTFGLNSIRLLIEGNGYGYENYTVTTEDGYLLNLNRIVHPNRTGSDRGYPLLLVNGYFMQSEAWLVQQELDSNLGFVFADKGYDVWLGDQRGTERSKGHINQTIDESKLWDFTYHETGVYDFPAFIDFILNKTNHEDLIFSCMSLGCTFHSVLGSKRPSYNQKIRAAIYFVPVISNNRQPEELNSFVYLMLRTVPALTEISEKSGRIEWHPNLGNLKKEFYHVCRLLGYNLYRLFAKIMFGSGFHIPHEKMCNVIALSMGGASSRVTKHIVQVFDNAGFSEFDYGREENLKKYGTALPPLYDLKKITTPIAFYYSDIDQFTSPKGLQKTIKLLGGPSYTCELPNFNHLDVAAGSTFRFVLPDVINLLDSLTGRSNDTEKFKSGKCPSMEWIRHLN